MLLKLTMQFKALPSEDALLCCCMGNIYSPTTSLVRTFWELVRGQPLRLLKPSCGVTFSICSLSSAPVCIVGKLLRRVLSETAQPVQSTDAFFYIKEDITISMFRKTFFYCPPRVLAEELWKCCREELPEVCV